MALLRKITCNLRHPMSLGHPVRLYMRGVPTPYCIWSVIQSQSPILISLVSFQRNVAKETKRTRQSIEIRERRNDTPNAIGCISFYLSAARCITYGVCERLYVCTCVCVCVRERVGLCVCERECMYLYRSLYSPFN